jgi:magnesium-transporting ATPase (P-type)
LVCVLLRLLCSGLYRSCYLATNSSQTIYDPIFITLYNVVFTSLPVIAVGIFEQDVSAEDSIKTPALYEAGLKNSLFSYGQFLLSLVKGLVHSIIIYFVTFCALYKGGEVKYNFMSIISLTIAVWT